MEKFTLEDPLAGFDSEEQSTYTDTGTPTDVEVEVEYPTYGGIPDPEYPEYTFETKGGKTIKVTHDKMGSFWSVSFVPGGQLPAELQGKFTRYTEANEAVEIYLARKEAE